MKLGRNPFSRETVTHKRVKSDGGGGCDFCGAHNYDKKARYRYLWKFVVERDSVRGSKSEVKGAFCSIGCCNAYHGG